MPYRKGRPGGEKSSDLGEKEGNTAYFAAGEILIVRADTGTSSQIGGEGGGNRRGLRRTSEKKT